MDTSESVVELLAAVSRNMDTEKLVLSTIQGLIAAEISARRIKKEMTQKEFARLLGVSQSTLSKWESGESNFTLSTLASIAVKLDIEMQSPFLPTMPQSYSPGYSKVIVFNPKGWRTSAATVFSPASETETISIPKEM